MTATRIDVTPSDGSPPYQVQTTTGLINSAWSNLGGPISTNTLVLTPSSVTAFYRVQGQ